MTTKTILSNAFSLNMLSVMPANLAVLELSLEEARTLAAGGFESSVGHADIAAVMSEQLGLTVEPNRSTISLSGGERLLVGQYRGPRLLEGATTLPEGATIQWLSVEVS